MTVEGPVPRTYLLAFVAAALLLGADTAELEGQDPDSVVRIAPIMVRVLGSAVGTDAPYPVSVIAGPELTRGTSPVFIEDALRAVPGVQIHNRYNLAVGERIAVRGFGPRSQFGVRGVRILVDGIPATLPDGQATLDHLDLAGLGRVEALRGPNAALYGNAAGGVLHFQTRDPALEPASVGVRWTGATLGSSAGATPTSEVSHGMWTLEGSATGTSGSAGYRVGFSRTDFDGFRRNPQTDDGQAYGAATRSVFNGTLSLPLADGTLRVVANGVDLEAENAGSLPQGVLDEGDRAAWGFNVISGAFKAVKQGQTGASWTGPVGATTADFAVWGIRRELDNPIPGSVIDLNRNAGGVRSVFQGRHDLADGTAFGWGVGFETELQKDDRKNFENNSGSAGALTLDQDERVRAAGLFVQGRLDLGRGVSFLGGLRYDNISFSVDDRFVTGDPDDTGERTMDAVSPSAGIVIAATPDVEFFGSIGRSFETPTTTELANRPSGAGGFNPDLDPQTGVTIEGGVRGTVAARLGLELSVFRTKLEDGLVPFEVASDPGRTYFRNAARSRHTGWEVSADGALAPDLSARVAYTNIDATYDFYETDTDVFSGNAVPGLAPQRLDGVLMFTPGSAFVELRGLWQDDIPVDDAGTASSPSYFLADVRLGMEDLPAGGLSIAPFFAIANLFGETYNASVVPNAFGSRYFEPGPGRTYRLGFGLTWGGRR